MPPPPYHQHHYTSTTTTTTITTVTTNTTTATTITTTSTTTLLLPFWIRLFKVLKSLYLLGSACTYRRHESCIYSIGGSNDVDRSVVQTLKFVTSPGYSCCLYLFPCQGLQVINNCCTCEETYMGYYF
jgi:hypothetical protein